MATAEEVAALRLLVAEPDDAPPYSDAVLSARLDAVSGNQDVLAYQIWTEKAAAAANLVDMSEGGSSRKMGDLSEQALTMAETFRKRALAGTTPPTDSAGTRVKRLTRP